MSASPPLSRTSPATSSTPRTVAHLRWYMCALLFFATTVNYMDRQVIGILKPVFERDLGWSERDFSSVVFYFTLAYALMMPVAGRFIDWVGTRLGYTVAVLFWSAASMSHFFARTVPQFSIARFALGIGESANFPAAIKTVADWFPRRERALATGIFNSGSNVGAIAAPLLVPFIAVHFGWRFSFLCTGLLDLVWLAAWLLFFRQPEHHPRLAPQELALIQADRVAEPPERIPYRRLFSNRAALAFLLGKFLTDPVWWFYLFWLPGFLNRTYHLDLTHLGPPLVVIYVAADIGSIGGGWLSSRLIQRGWSITRGRKAAMLACALAVVPVAFVMLVGAHLWVAVALIALAAAAHQGWSANLYTITSDTFPKSAVASVVGFGSMGGAFGGMLVAPLVGWWLDLSRHAYAPLFVLAGSMYLVALLTIHLLLPRLQPTAL